MKYIVIAKRYHMGSVTDAYRMCWENRQRAIDDYVEQMNKNHWSIVTAEVCKDRIHISLFETELFLVDANEKYLNS